MTKHGTSFSTVIPATQIPIGSWNPYAFLHSGTSNPPVGDFISASRPRKILATAVLPYAPIEYRHISPAGNASASFNLTKLETASAGNQPGVAPQSLIIGTMRAYLGNVAVTPQLDWIDEVGMGGFAVKSEFLVVEPTDGLVYFWWHFLRSRYFLRQLPPGGGGTRPRLDAAALLGIPVRLPSLAHRQDINGETRAIAEAEWRNRLRLDDLAERVQEELNH